MRKPSIRLLAVLVALGSLAGCFSFGRGHGPVDAFQFLASRNPTLGRNVTGAMNENADPVEITVVVPPSVRSLDLVATFSLNTEALITVVSSGRPVSQENGISRNDFSAPVIYSLQVPGEKQPWRYRVTVRYAETDATLSQITIPEGYAMSPLFSPKVKSYTVEVPWSVRKVRIEARGQSRNMQDIVIDGAGSGGSSASVTVDFSSGLSRAVSIETLAEDGETRDAYTVTLRRLSADANAKLASLEIVDTPFFPAFSPTRAAYQVEVPFDATSIVLKAKAQSAYATITLQTLAVVGRITSGRTALPSRGNPADRAGATIDFSNGTLLPVIVAVTAEDGGVQEYQIDVVRAAPDRNNALAELVVEPGRMSPAFNPRVFAYAVEVPFSTQQLVIAAKAQSTFAKMELVPGPVSANTVVRPLKAKGDVGARGGVTVEFATAERISLAVAVTAQDGRTQQYVLDVRRAPPDANADLGSLTASAGVLSPIFSPRVISYAVSLPAAVESVKLTATAASAVAVVTVEGSTARPAVMQAFTVTVAGGATETVNLLVSAEDGTQKLYRVRVSREAGVPPGGQDGNARLARLQLAGAELVPAFRPDVLDYEAKLASNVASVTLTATAESPAAAIAVDGQPLARTGRVIALEPGTARTVLVDVTAGNGAVVRTIVWLSRDRAVPGRDTNTRLARLQLAGAQLAPTFRPDTLDYEATLAANVASVVLTAAAESPAATIEVDGQLLARTGRVIALEPGTVKTVLVDVTAESGAVARTILWLSRDRTGPGRDTNARLGSLRLAGAQLTPAFNPLVLDYGAKLAASVASVTLSAEAESPAATIEVDGQPLARTGRVIALEPGAEKMVIIDVTAESGIVSSTILWLSRDRAGPGKDTNARLAGLRLIGAQLSPSFDPRVLDYAATLAADVDSVILTATAESPVAAIAVDGLPLARNGRLITLEPGAARTVRIDVTAESGAVARTVVRLNREAAQDANARLARLQLVGAQLSPSFDARVFEYSARLAANVASVTLTAAAESPVATIAVDGQPLARTGRVIALEPGTARTVIVDVRAESGATARTVIRLSRESAKDTNARLARLQLVGAQLTPGFDARVFEYSAQLATNVASVTLTAAAESPVATIEVDGQPLARTGRVIALEPGAARTVIVDVTAESGAVARTVIRLGREAAQDANARLARLQLVGAQLTPGFDARVFEYSAQLATNVASVTLTATAESPVATIAVDGQPLARTGRVIALEPGATRNVIVDVTAESGAVARTVVRLSREAAQDTNARLARLQLVGAQISPSFDARVFEYSAKLAANVASVTLVAATESPVATIEVDGQPLARTGRVIAVEPGATRTVIVDVTAESGAVARTVVRLSRDGATVPPVVTPGSDRVSVRIDGVKVEQRGATGNSISQGSLGEEATITVRQYRTNTVIVQGSTGVSVKMQGATAVLSASWNSPGVKLERGRLVEVEVAIPAGGSNWLHYTEAQWADATVEIDVPFLLLSRNPRVSWPPIGSPVRVIGYVALSPGGSQRSEIQAGAESFELDKKGEYGVEVIITDAATGRVLAQDTVWGKPGLPRGHVFTFSKPISLPEGATVKYTLAAKAKNGQGWTASGTAEIWTTRITDEGGFEPVTLQLGESLKPPK